MARKPATTAIDDLPPAMDYAQHESTYEAFITFIKCMIASLGLLMVSLYFFVIAGNPVLGTVFLVASPIAAVFIVVRARR